MTKYEYITPGIWIYYIGK